MNPEALQAEALEAIKNADSSQAVEGLRVAWLGKKGKLTDALKSLASLSVEEKKTYGAALNKTKQAIAQAIEAKAAALCAQELEAKLKGESVDITLPVAPDNEGRIHPITQVIAEITAIFAPMGFSVKEGPDIEDDFHNFTALNIPESHPARQMHDTFYLQGDKEGELPVLRTHTSPVQIRTMKHSKPPFRCLAPGATFRSDSDQTHTPMFHQVEGFVVDKGIHMGHLKHTLIQFLEQFFGVKDLPVQFRPSFFPFTEPSAEVDIGCKRSKDGLLVGQGSDWLEVLGCGMIHPNVLKACDLDPDEWQGFAFGMGVERLAMLKYNIPDLRTFFASDARWLDHYGFNAFNWPGAVA